MHNCFWALAHLSYDMSESVGSYFIAAFSIDVDPSKWDRYALIFRTSRRACNRYLSQLSAALPIRIIQMLTFQRFTNIRVAWEPFLQSEQILQQWIVWCLIRKSLHFSRRCGLCNRSKVLEESTKAWIHYCISGGKGKGSVSASCNFLPVVSKGKLRIWSFLRHRQNNICFLLLMTWQMQNIYSIWAQ